MNANIIALGGHTGTAESPPLTVWRGLLCRFCWVSEPKLLQPSRIGEFYTAETAAAKLRQIAVKSGFRLLRLSGGEPALGKEHLLSLLEALQGKGYLFILETNGIPIAVDSEYAQQLARYRYLHIRVSLKGCSPNEFARLTGARPENFLQLEALERLVEH